jgi:gliding motility-associated-like protein
MTKKYISYIIIVLGFISFSGSTAQVVADFNTLNSGVFCNPETLQFQNNSTGIGNLSYEWNFGVLPGINSTLANPNFSYFSCGTFIITLKVSNQFGDTDTKTLPIIIHCSPYTSFGMDDTTACEGSIISFKDYSILNGELCSYIWNFNDPSSGTNNTSSQYFPSHIYNSSNTYNAYLIVTSSWGCSDTAFNQVFINSNPTLNAGNDLTICSSNPTQLSATGASSYNWSPNTALNNATISNPVSQTSISTTYTLTGYNSNGCSASDQVVVSVFSSSSINAGSDKYVCGSNQAQIQASGLNSYTWSPSLGLSSTTGSSITANPPYSQPYILNGTDNNGCSVSDTVIVYVYPLPIADAGIDKVVCENEEVILQGSGGNYFEWLPNNINNANSYQATANPSSTTTYTLIVSFGNNCSSSDQVIVTVKPKPILNTNDKEYCPGSAVQISASGAVSYSWQPSTYLSQTNVPNPIVIPNQEMIYTVTGISANGCSAISEVIVFPKIPFDMVTSPGGIICNGGNLQLEAFNSLTYEWFPNIGLDNPYVPTPVASPSYSITYKVKGTDGCYIDSSYVEVKVNNDLGVDAGSEYLTFANNPIQIETTGSGTYEWVPAIGLDCSTCQNPIATVSENTTYVVTQYNEAGCRSEDTVVVLVECSNNLVFIPNAFTPNGDGKNEKFYIRTKGLNNLEYFRIYSRNGMCVFETTDVNDGWDGTYKGKVLPPGVFSYYASAICTQNQKIEMTGNVTLIR